MSLFIFIFNTHLIGLCLKLRCVNIDYAGAALFICLILKVTAQGERQGGKKG